MDLFEAINNIDLETMLTEYGAELKDTSDSNEKRLKTCPSCQNNDYKLYVNLDTKKFFCFICQFGYKSNPIFLLSQISGKDYNVVKSEILLNEYPTPKELLLDIKFNKRTKLEEDTFVTRIKHCEIPNTINILEDESILNYAKSRGITVELIHKYSLIGSTKIKNFDRKFLVFPINFGYTTVGFQSRDVLNNNPKLRYVSGPELSNWLYPLINTNLEAIKESKRVLLVEGPIDAIGAIEFGIHTFCTFGKHLSKQQLEFLTLLGVKELILGWDLDATKEIISFANKYKRNFKVKVLKLNSNKKVDFGDYLINKDYNFYKEAYDSSMDPDSLEFYRYQLEYNLTKNETKKT